MKLTGFIVLYLLTVVYSQGPRKRIVFTRNTEGLLMTRRGSCHVCKRMITSIDLALKMRLNPEPSEVLIIYEISQVCASLGDVYSSECNYIIKRYSWKIRHQFQQEKNSQNICANLKICGPNK